MILFSKCMCCLADQQQRFVEKFDDEEKKAAFMKEVMSLIGSKGSEYNAPWLSAEITEIREKYYGKQDDILQKKRQFNEYLLRLEEELKKKIQKEQDPLKEALRYARIGNYIDFSAVENVTVDDFMILFQNEKDQIDSAEYENFRTDLARSDNLIYIMDNCGEIVLDKLVIQELKKQYPHLHIMAMVRGKDAVNDATMEDARMTGIDQEVSVIDNNSSVQGVILPLLTKETKAIFDGADIIISKGQGNFESLYGCGKNIYYLFLCKCDLFTKRFGVERFEGMFLNENRIKGE